MGRTLGAAVPAALLAARCAPASPITGSPRLWQRCTTPIHRFKRSLFTTPARYDADSPNSGGSSKSVAGRVSWGPNTLHVELSAKPSAVIPLSHLWLRDACPCAQCVDPHSGQKTFSTTDLPDRMKVEHAELDADGSLTVVWSSDLLSGGDRHTSTFPAKEVQSWSNTEAPRSAVVTADAPYAKMWDGKEYQGLLDRGSCRVSYDAWINDDEAFWAAFADLSMTGLIFVTGVPHGEDQVERIAGRIGQLQHTFYGRTWDVKSKPRAENVAYTSAFLGLHQDLTYHNPMPKLQLLHCLENSCEGGESLFSNSLRAAHELLMTSPRDYKTLSKHPVFFHYQKAGHHYFQYHSTIQTWGTNAPRATYWAPPFQTTFSRSPGIGGHQSMLAWKSAATRFQNIAESPDNMVEVKLQPGECVIFDNKRVLHGRRQFATTEGSRWLKGCYISPQVYAAKVTEGLSRDSPAGESLQKQCSKRSRVFFDVEY